MDNKVTDYTFTIIEDGQVPLAGNFDTVNYMPVVAMVVFCLILLAVASYTIWLLSRSNRMIVN